MIDAALVSEASWVIVGNGDPLLMMMMVAGSALDDRALWSVLVLLMVLNVPLLMNY